MSAASIPKIVELPLDEDDEVKPSTSKTTLRPVERGTSGASRKKSAAASSPPSSSSSWTRFLIKWTLFTLLTAFGAAQFIAGDLLWGYRGKYTKVETYMPPPARVFTPEELWEFNGTDPDKPVYLSIMGKVYDVTAGRWIYGPLGSYHFFAGRDASRAYVTGCFETHLTHDLRGLTLEEIQQVAMWKAFFDEHHRYRPIGTLDLPHIDPSTPIPPPCHNNAPPKDPSAVAS